MTESMPPKPTVLLRGRFRRLPAVPVAMAFGAGIASDRLSGGSLAFGLLGAAAALVAWRLARNPWVGCLALLAACAGLGHAWHHWCWSAVRRDHLTAMATDTPGPAKIIARIRETPVVIPPRDDGLSGGSPKLDRTVCTVDCEAVASSGEFVAASGIVRLEVDGHLPQVGRGDRVEIVGRIARPAARQNPGGFDFRNYLRAGGIHVLIRCREPDGVTVLASGSDPRRLLGRLRAEAERLLTEQLSPATAPIGVAMLLGTRSGLPEDVRDAFRKSGTMHVLAISGLHVAILAGLVWFAASALNVGRRAALLWMLAAVLAYAAITDAQPSVVRAVLMISLLVAGRLRFRSGSMLQSLALAALGVLAVNPAHLFDTGAQLSFLAVAGLAWAPSWQRPVRHDPSRGLLTGIAAWLGRSLWAGLEATAAVWLFTLPLTAWSFHLVSPVGFLLNVILAPLSVVVLCAGYLLLMAGLLFPPLAGAFGGSFDVGLRGLLWLVEAAAATPMGHIPVSGPPLWWLAGFYGGLVVMLLAGRRSVVARLSWRGLAAWTAVGMVVAAFPRSNLTLRATFLSVGHGVAVLIELPNGRSLLYDAGRLQDAGRAEEIVQAALWSRGRTAVDALVMSHADVDHFNAVPGLADEGALRMVCLHPSFLDFRQVPVQTVCERCAARQIPLRFLWAGDRLRLDSSVDIEVLHPRVADRFPADNENSLVLRITYAGRSLLLTGDLEGQGLVTLLGGQRRPVDVLMAPHHGSRGANTPALAGWAAPELVIASSGFEGTEQRLEPIFGSQTRIWSTRERGAIEIDIHPDGTIESTAFR